MFAIIIHEFMKQIQTKTESHNDGQLSFIE